MAELVIPDIKDTIWRQLQELASTHGRTPEAEARAILEEALQPGRAGVWAQVDALRERLAASGRTFSDSTELLREDRER
ncbi:MAG: hypothetical protein L0Z62_28100 [Gemmataceae bacterium]|nr:hypothetical protein [Gemmataceae bacterium]